MDVSELLGKTFQTVRLVDNDVIQFISESGPDYRMYHAESCCESVYVEDVVGELSWLEGAPITQAEQVSSEGTPPLTEREDSFTWTFYRIATAKGSVTIRWYGSSNGYYSEEVDFEQM